MPSLKGRAGVWQFGESLISARNGRSIVSARGRVRVVGFVTAGAGCGLPKIE
ncbi:MAG: hypothetical protein HFG72_01415 [Hungatella sp.]|nr:hypothetical protein [Hungatella sp.]